MAIYCPGCRRTDTIRKSSAIVAEGTWSGTAYSGNPYQGSYPTTNRTQLVANLLANEPRRKQVFGCASCLTLVFLGAIGFICFYATGFGFYHPEYPYIAPVGLIGVVVCGGSAILLLVTSAVRSARNSRQWTINHALWEQDFERQYYCSQCDRVFYV
jgi:hypothetical protein